MKIFFIISKARRKILLFMGCLLIWKIMTYTYDQSNSAEQRVQMTQKQDVSTSQAYKHPESYKKPETVLGMSIHQPTWIAGIQRENQVSLTIGIPTVKRAYGIYLFDTLQSLVNGSTDRDKDNITVVVFIADSDPQYNQEVIDQVTNRFSHALSSGFLHIVRAPIDHYPSLLHLYRTFGDSATRVAWRSKQNLDYAALMAYSQNICKYYLQLEDDVIAAPNYYNNIMSFINSKKEKWTMLDFSPLGFIGKLYYCRDLMKLAILLRTYFNEQPCDFLLSYFLKLMLQTTRYIREPTIFKHRGIHSSLLNITRTTEKIDFPARINTNENPPADLRTNMEAFENNILENAYIPKRGNSVFWTTTPNVGDFIEIIFKNPIRIKRIVVTTGFSSDNQRDIILGARLDVGYDIVAINNNAMARCSELHTFGEFTKGTIDISFAHNSTMVKCILITITKKQEMWVYIREIAVIV